MLIAIPSEVPGGLDANVSEHFGHCAAFTLVNVEDGVIGEVTVLGNAGHEQGGCMAPVHLLKGKEVDTLLAGGMGMRPLSGFQQVGIAVYSTESAHSVREAVELFLADKCRQFGEGQTCGGGGGECGHHHQPVEREPIVGKADVREDRVVSFDYELKDADGGHLDSSTRTGPMRYLHGGGRLLPGLERALTGLEAGDSVVAEIPCAEAFGEHEEDRVVDVPRDKLPAEAQAGVMVTLVNEHGQHIPMMVIEIGESTAKLDGNHVLAGRDLVFNVTVLNVEAATAEEISHGHVH